MPAWWNSSTARCAISGVCSAGLASTTLPAASAAATWPVKIASGKFHGLMQVTGPSASTFGGAVHLRRVIAQEVDRFAHFGDRVRQRLAGFAHGQRHQLVAVFLEQVGDARDRIGADRRRRGLPVHRIGGGAGQRGFDVGRRCFAHLADDVLVEGRIADRLRFARASIRRRSAAQRHTGAAAPARPTGRSARLRWSGRCRTNSCARRRTSRAAARCPDAARRPARARRRTDRRSASRSTPSRRRSG